MASHQPLLADTLLTNQENEIIAGTVAIQAQPFDGEGRTRQIERLTPGALGIQADQHRLLTLALDGSQQQPLLVRAMVEPFEAPGIFSKGAAAGVHQV